MSFDALYSSSLPLAQFIDPSPLRVPPETSALEVIRWMHQTGKCALVIAETQLCGIFTHQDVVRAAATGMDLAATPIAEVMTQPVVTLAWTAGMTLQTALSGMAEHQIHHLPVLDSDDRLIGLLNQDALLRGLAREPQPISSPNPSPPAQSAQTHPEWGTVEEVQEQPWQALFDHALDAILIADDQGCYLDANPAACQLFGVSKAELLSSCVADFADPAMEITQLWQQFLQQGQMMGEFRLRCPDGTARQTEFAAIANFIPGRHLSILRDISARVQLEADRKTTEIALNESEERFRLAVEAAKMGTWDWNILTNEVIWSESMERLMGMAPGSFDRQMETVVKMIHPEDLVRVQDAINASLAHGADYEIDFRFIKPDGSIRWAVGRGSVLRDGNGRAVRMLGVDVDMTDRKGLELSLQTSEQKLSRILDSAIASITNFRVFANWDWDYGYFSAGCERLFGYTAEELIADKHLWLSQIVSEDRDRILPLLYEAFFTETDITLEYRFCHKNGSIRWLSCFCGSQRIDADCWVITAVNCDITERKQAEETIRENEQRCHQILDSITDMVLVKRPDSRFIWANKAFRDYYGMSLEQLQGMIDAPFNQPEYTYQYLRDDALVFATGQPLEIPEEPVTRHDGVVRTFSTIKTPVFDQDGQPILLVGVLRDISDRKQLELSLQASELKLSQILDRTIASITVFRIFANRDWDYEYFTSGCEKLFGYKCQELIADKLLWMSRVFPPDRETILLPMFDTLLIEGHTTAEYRFYHKDGSLRWISSAYAAEQIAPDCWRITTLCQDITDRKTAEIALQESEARLRLALDISKASAWEHNLQTDQVFFTSTITPELYPQVRTYAESLALVHPDDLETVLRANQEAIAQGGTFQFEHRVLVEGQVPQVRWMQVSGQIVRDNRGVPMRTVGMSIDITERKQAELQLRELNKALCNTVEGISRIDQQGNYTFVNEAYADMLGYEPAEMIGLNWQVTVHPAELELARATYEQMQSTGKAKLKTRGIRKDGAVLHCRLVFVAVYDSQDCFIGHYCFREDITEKVQLKTDRAKAELALRESEERFRTLSAAAPIGICQTDPDGNCLYTNARWQEMSGLSFEDSLGQGWLQAIYPDDRSTLAAAWVAYVRGECDDLPDFRLLTPKGEIRWVSACVGAIKSPTGEIIGYVSTDEDITERKQAEQALQDSQQRFQTILDNSPTAIYLLDLQNNFLLVNRICAAMVSLTPEDLLGKNIYEFWPREIADGFAANNRTVFETGQLLQVEEVVPHLNGQQRTYITVKFPLCDATGNPYAICGISTDISEKKELESQFLRAQRLESIGTLASGIAHDLNNMLTPILVSSQLLQRQLPDGRPQELLKIMEANARRGADLIRQVLTFARGAEGKRMPLQIKNLLMEIQQICERTFPKSITIALDVSSTFSTILADPTQLHQVMMNLCVNARDAMPAGGHLHLRLEDLCIDETYARFLALQSGAYIVITVSDTGTGIAPEVLERIFDPFFTTKAVGQGTGLGLSVAEGIIRSHDGIITVESEVGHGSQFKLYLPAATTSPTQVLPEQNNSQGQGELILVVDDEANLLTITKTVLEDHNYRVITAPNGIAALSSYVQHQHEIRVVLMDMMMPEMDGSTTIAVLKKINPQIKIIACSGLSSLLRQDNLRVGINASLAKPYTADELLTIVAQVLG